MVDAPRGATGGRPSMRRRGRAIARRTWCKALARRRGIEHRDRRTHRASGAAASLEAGVSSSERKPGPGARTMRELSRGGSAVLRTMLTARRIRSPRSDRSTDVQRHDVEDAVGARVSAARGCGERGCGSAGGLRRDLRDRIRSLVVLRRLLRPLLGLRPVGRWLEAELVREPGEREGERRQLPQPVRLRSHPFEQLGAGA